MFSVLTLRPCLSPRPMQMKGQFQLGRNHVQDHRALVPSWQRRGGCGPHGHIFSIKSPLPSYPISDVPLGHKLVINKSNQGNLILQLVTLLAKEQTTGHAHFVNLQKRCLSQIRKHDDPSRRGTTLNSAFYPLKHTFLSTLYVSCLILIYT